MNVGANEFGSHELSCSLRFLKPRGTVMDFGLPTLRIKSRAHSFWAALGIAVLMILPPAAEAQARKDTAEKSAVQSSPDTMWNLGDLYATPEAWTASYAKTKAAVESLDKYKGSLGTSANAMFEALDAISAVRKEVERLLAYAFLKGDEDLRVSSAQERRQQAGVLRTAFSEKTSWMTAEIIGIGAAKVAAFAAENKALNDRFGFYLTDTLRYGPHTLGDEAEAALAAAGNVLAQPNRIYEELANADLPFPTITLEGEKLRLDEPAYEKYRQSPDRAERKLVFDTFWPAWKQFENTAGATLAAGVMGNVFLAKEHKFNGALAAALFNDNMPEAVYRTLVAQANAALPTLYRYLKMRKARLGITDDLAYYDNYPPMFVLDNAPAYTVAESERITLEALAPMGKEYLALLRKGFAGRWMNVLPHEGKHPGAYMEGVVYDVHPYLLFNHNNDYDSLSTFAHEWGHAVHTLLTHANQPYEKANYSTFTAESASIANEMLLNDYMVKHAKSKAQKLYYLGQGVEFIRTSYFRQAMFGEFELAIHEEIQKGAPLSGSRLTEMYCRLLKHYYGDAEGVMKIDPKYCIEWAFVPHFYYNFYVWQYATSSAGAAQFTDAIFNGGVAGRERFLNMLKAGGSAYPYDLYKRAGLDMATPAPYQALAARMNRLMDEIEALEKTK
jgi:oligoendopeptidase F